MADSLVLYSLLKYRMLLAFGIFLLLASACSVRLLARAGSQVNSGFLHALEDEDVSLEWRERAERAARIAELLRAFSSNDEILRAVATLGFICRVQTQKLPMSNFPICQDVLLLLAPHAGRAVARATSKLPAIAPAGH